MEEAVVEVDGCAEEPEAVTGPSVVHHVSSCPQHVVNRRKLTSRIQAQLQTYRNLGLYKAPCSARIGSKLHLQND